VSKLDDDGTEILIDFIEIGVSLLEIGEEKEISFNWSPDSYDTEYFLRFFIDSDNVITECNEENNQMVPSSIVKSKEKPPESTPLSLSIMFIALMSVTLIYVIKRREK